MGHKVHEVQRHWTCSCGFTSEWFSIMKKHFHDNNATLTVQEKSNVS